MGSPPIAYVTDVEGQWNKLATFAEGNPWVSIDGAGRLVVAPGAIFVFGGDAIDRGPEGRRVVAALLEVRRRQPDQVVLLAGNRDINKLRLPRELGGHPPSKAPPALSSAPRGDLLRWIFDNTMGARQAFAHRATELRAAGTAADDDAVVQSYLDDLAPTGALTEYLCVAQLAFRSGATLFVHGGVTDDSFGVVPDGRPRTGDVDQWVAALNDFYARQLAAYREGALDAAGVPRWNDLIAYQAPLPGTRLNQASVVYGRPTDDVGNPLLPAERVIRALATGGVTRVVLGHTPSGDCPSVLRDGAGFELILADNSYGRVERGSQLYLDDDPRVAGVTLLDGAEAPRAVRFSLAAEGAASPLGRRVATGHLVKARLAEAGDYLLFRSGPGYVVEQTAAAAAALTGPFTG